MKFNIAFSGNSWVLHSNVLAEFNSTQTERKRKQETVFSANFCLFCYKIKINLNGIQNENFKSIANNFSWVLIYIILLREFYGYSIVLFPSERGMCWIRINECFHSEGDGNTMQCRVNSVNFEIS